MEVTGSSNRCHGALSTAAGGFWPGAKIRSSKAGKGDTKGYRRSALHDMGMELDKSKE